jgi:hypothetical protein
LSLAALKVVASGNADGALKLHPVDLLGHGSLALIQCIVISFFSGESSPLLPDGMTSSSHRLLLSHDVVWLSGYRSFRSIFALSW